MKNFEITADDRKVVGTSSSKKLRREQGLVPAVLYGTKKDTKSISLRHNEILKILRDDSIFTTVIKLNCSHGCEEVIIKDIQYHPFKNKILHVDFIRVDRKERIDVHVPIDFTGIDASPGKKAGGIFTKHITAIDIKCLPEDLVESIKVDVSEMNIEESIHISEISLPDRVEFVKKPTEQDDPAILSIHLPKQEESEESKDES